MSAARTPISAARTAMRRRFWLWLGGFLLIMMVWGGLWFVRQAETARAPAAFAAALAAEGWRVEVGEASVAGFPNRLDLSVSALSVAPPDGAWRWRVDNALARAVVYNRSHWVLSAEGPHAIDTPFGAWRLSAPEARASVVFEEGRLARFALDAPAVSTRGPSGALRLVRVRLHARQRPGALPSEGLYEAVLRIDGLAEGAADASPGQGPWRWDALVRLTPPSKSAPLTAPYGFEVIEVFEADGLSSPAMLLDLFERAADSDALGER